MPEREAENERRMRQYIEAWNDHDIDAIVDFLADGSEQYSSAELRTVCESWFTAFPDLTHEIAELAANGNWVLGRTVLHGTHRGPYRGIPPTGNDIEVADHFSTRFEDGVVVEHHVTTDVYTLLGQLGVTLPPDRTREEEHKALVRQYFAALNERDEDAFRDTLAEDFEYGEITGPDEMVEVEWTWQEAFDLQWEVQAMHADGDHVTTRLVVTGTHREAFRGLEPSGESFEITATTVSRIEDGKMAEWWGEWDFAGLLNQIGAIDSPVYG